VLLRVPPQPSLPLAGPGWGGGAQVDNLPRAHEPQLHPPPPLPTLNDPTRWLCAGRGGCVCVDRYAAGRLEDLVNSQAIMQSLVISRGFSERFLLITEIACDYIDEREDSFSFIFPLFTLFTVTVLLLILCRLSIHRRLHRRHPALVLHHGKNIPNPLHLT
jgi:hypothetical protein